MTWINYGSKSIKEIYLWNPWGSRLPSAYQEVEWIWTTWSQFINTWVNLWTTWIQVETKITVNTTSLWSYWLPVFWNYYNWDPWSVESAKYYNLTPYNNSWYFWTYNNSSWYAWTYSTTIWTQYTIVFNNSSNYFTVNWTNMASVSWAKAYSSLYTLAISRRWTIRSWDVFYGQFNYHYFKVYDRNTWAYVRDMIPCYRKSDNVIWMYDLINNQFYTNNWTWTFTKWADVNYDYTPIKAVYYGSINIRPSQMSWYQKVEYIANSWTQWIDTGLRIWAWYRTVQKAMFTASTTNSFPWFIWWYLGGNYRAYLCWVTSSSWLHSWWIYTSFAESPYNGITWFSLNTTHEYDVKFASWDSYIKFDWDTKVRNTASWSTSATYTYNLFANNSSDWRGINPWMRIYSAKFYNTSNVLVRDFVPCYRISDNVIWMYDLVEWKFYTNSWSWTFTKWANVN